MVEARVVIFELLVELPNIMRGTNLFVKHYWRLE